MQELYIFPLRFKKESFYKRYFVCSEQVVTLAEGGATANN